MMNKKTTPTLQKKVSILRLKVLDQWKYEPFADQEVMHHYASVKHLSILILNEGMSLLLFY